eukprot:Gb_18943 [translate_table: standard]
MTISSPKPSRDSFFNNRNNPISAKPSTLLGSGGKYTPVVVFVKWGLEFNPFTEGLVGNISQFMIIESFQIVNSHEDILILALLSVEPIIRRLGVTGVSFSGNGRAFLFTRAMNVKMGPKEDRQLMTGLHTVADIFCSDCQEVLGWKYERAYEESQKYKEGKYILEKSKIMKENWLEVAVVTVLTVGLPVLLQEPYISDRLGLINVYDPTDNYNINMDSDMDNLLTIQWKGSVKFSGNTVTVESKAFTTMALIRS